MVSRLTSGGSDWERSMTRSVWKGMGRTGVLSRACAASQARSPGAPNCAAAACLGSWAYWPMVSMPKRRSCERAASGRGRRLAGCGARKWEAALTAVLPLEGTRTMELLAPENVPGAEEVSTGATASRVLLDAPPAQGAEGEGEEEGTARDPEGATVLFPDAPTSRGPRVFSEAPPARVFGDAPPSRVPGDAPTSQGGAG